MFKVFAFLKRNTALLSHDDYRAGHVGFHCCNSRRLRDIRGYAVNIWANAPLAPRLGRLHAEIVRNEPAGFLELWDGFPEVWFDSQRSWTGAATPEPTRAMAGGLAVDPDWTLGDGPHLFDPIPDRPTEFRSYHLHMDEHVVVPVERPEHKLTKLMLFFRRNPALDDTTFRQGVRTGYAPLWAQLAGLHGCTLNFRDLDQDAAFRDFYPADAWAFSDEGRAMRRAFCALWDGAIELHVDSVEAFVAARSAPALHPALCAEERHLFDAHWYVEVDENMIVMPNRGAAPAFYYR